VVGTLIDFERGILEWFQPRLETRGMARTEVQIRADFALSEHKFQCAAPHKPFTAMLPLVYKDMAARGQMAAGEHEEARDFQQSIQSWPAFPDTPAAQRELKRRYRLVAVTHADAWALKSMSANIGNPFDAHISCDQVGVNKPSPLLLQPQRRDILQRLHSEPQAWRTLYARSGNWRGNCQARIRIKGRESSLGESTSGGRGSACGLYIAVRH